MQIFDCINNLSNHHLGLFLGESLMFLQVKGQIRPFTIFKYSTECILIDLYSSIESHNVGMI